MHNPANVAGAEAALEAFPDATHVAVFDTAFHVSSMGPEAFSYALPASMRTLGGGGGGVRSPSSSSLFPSPSPSPSSPPLPAAAAVPVRKYGFHGSSFKHALLASSKLLGLPLPPHEAALNAVAFHLGAGASAAAICRGQSVDTSLGATPLQGLVMATRCGDVDPAVSLMVAAERERERERWRERSEEGGGGDLSAPPPPLPPLTAAPPAEVIEGVLRSLNREAGLAALAGPGVSPSGDMRDVIAAAEREEKAEEEAKSGRKAGEGFLTRNEQHSSARLAVSVYVHRIRHYLGAYLLNKHLNGRAHAIIFTGGVGENSPLIRARVLEGLEGFGIEVDTRRNERAVGGVGGDGSGIEAVRIDKFEKGGSIAVVVVPADEEAVIAREAWDVAMRRAKKEEKK